MATPRDEDYEVVASASVSGGNTRKYDLCPTLGSFRSSSCVPMYIDIHAPICIDIHVPICIVVQSLRAGIIITVVLENLDLNDFFLFFLTLTPVCVKSD